MTAGGDVTLEARGLKKSYRSVAALHELTFTARAGEVIGLLGRNGAGKTTAIRVLTTVLPPTSGTFAVAGAPHTRPAAIRRRVGVLPESAGYPEQQTGVNSGDFGIYVVVLPSHSPETQALAVSPALGLHATEQKTLNSGGVLPLVLGIPALLGLLTLGLRVRRRR
jgi:ABC-type multidrug transport system ATPase subunit